MTWLRNGNVQPDTGFTVGDVSYPAGWIANNSQAERDKLNIRLAAVPNPHDQRFSWGWKADGTENWKDLAGLKENWVSRQRDICQGCLSGSDWMVIRKQEVGTAIPTKWADYRTALRLACNNRQTEINAVATTEALKALLVSDKTVVQIKKDGSGNDIEKKKGDGSSYDPKEYETEEVANTGNIDGKYPWPQNPDAVDNP